MKNKGILFVVSGPSGVGKGTICKALIEKRKDLYLSISATTRKARPEEVDGVNYYFLEEEEFLKKVKNKGFLEHAAFCGNYYGTPKDKVYEKLNQGIDVILEIEVVGAMKVRAEHPEAVFIFILPPSMKELRERLINRNTETEEVINQRLNTAAFEVSHIQKYNYIILNDEISNAVNRFEAIIDAEKCRIERNVEFINEVFTK